MSTSLEMDLGHQLFLAAVIIGGRLIRPVLISLTIIITNMRKNPRENGTRYDLVH